MGRVGRLATYCATEGTSPSRLSESGGATSRAIATGYRNKAPGRGYRCSGPAGRVRGGWLRVEIARNPKARNAKVYTRMGDAEAREECPPAVPCGSRSGPSPRRPRVASVAVTLAAEHAEENIPRADLAAILVRHRARDLVQVGEIVHRPGREQLGQRHGAEHGVGAAAIEIA